MIKTKVATPDYRSGWDRIFGSSQNAAETKMFLYTPKEVEEMVKPWENVDWLPEDEEADKPEL